MNKFLAPLFKSKNCMCTKVSDSIYDIFEFNNGNFEAAMDQLWNRFFSNKNIVSDVFKNSAKYPKTDIKITDNGYLFFVAIPGLKKDDVEITFDKNILTVKYDKKEENQTSKNQYALKELRHSSFIRSWEFQEEIKENEIKASTKDGILTIEIPANRIEEKQSKVKRIDIIEENNKTDKVEAEVDM